MIKMIRGTYGVKDKGVTVAMTKRSAPFYLSEKEEKRLVDARVAVYVDEKPAAQSQESKSTAKNGGKSPTDKPDTTPSENTEETT